MPGYNPLANIISGKAKNVSVLQHNYVNPNVVPSAQKMPWEVDISTLASQSSVPSAASNNASVKPMTNGALTTGQTLALAAGAMGIYSDYLGTKGQVASLKAQAKEYESQIPLNYAAYRNQVQYWSEENLANISRIRQEYEELSGQQMAAMGASGFDVSSGDQRILLDTALKAKNAIDLENRSTYLQSFELWRSTMIENSRLKAAAEMARSQAKYTKKMGKLNLVAGVIGTAANVLSLGSYGRTGDKNTKGV